MGPISSLVKTQTTLVIQYVNWSLQEPPEHTNKKTWSPWTMLPIIDRLPMTSLHVDSHWLSNHAHLNRIAPSCIKEHHINLYLHYSVCTYLN